MVAARAGSRLPGFAFWLCRSFLHEKEAELAGVSSGLRWRGKETGQGSTYPRAWHLGGPQHRLGIITSRVSMCRGRGSLSGKWRGVTHAHLRGERAPLVCRGVTRASRALPAAFRPPTLFLLLSSLLPHPVCQSLPGCQGESHRPSCSPGLPQDDVLG